MKLRKSTPFRSHASITTAFSVAFLAHFAAPSVSAATLTWNGGYATTGSWQNAGNWGGTAFANASDLVFGSTNINNITSTFLAGGKTAKSITFQAGSPAYNIRLASSGSGGTASILTFISTNTGITIDSGDLSNHTIGVSDGSVSLQGDLPVVHNGSGTLTINRPINGAFAVTKSGTGTLTLSAVNTYSGQTTINGGIVRCSVGGGSENSKVVLGDVSATHSVTVSNNTQTWTCAELAPTAAGEMEFNFGAVTPSTSVSPLTITGLADFSTSTPPVEVLVNTGLVPGTYPLMSWGSTSGTAPATVSVPTLLAGTLPSLSLSEDGLTLNLVITSTAATFVKANNTTPLNDGLSWVGEQAPGSSDVAKWDDTVEAPNTTSLGTDLTWGGIFIANPTGPVTINAGNTLAIGAAAVDIDMSTATADLTLNCPLALGAANVWNVAASQTLTLGGQVSGAFGITKLGDGTAILASSANNYTGNTTITGGTLRLGVNNVIPHGAGGVAGNVVVNGTLDLNGKSDSINGLSGSGVVDNTGAATSTLSVGNNAQTSTFNGVIQSTVGNVNLNKTGSGTLTLGNANTFSGAVSIIGGKLSFSNAAPLDNVSEITMGDGTRLGPVGSGVTINAPITVGASGTTVTINGNSAEGSTGSAFIPFTLSGAISGNGNVDFTGIDSTNDYSRINLDAASDYAGSTLFTTISGTNNANIFVFIGVDDALPVTTVLTMDGGVGTGGGRFCELNLNSHDQTLAGLQSETKSLRTQSVVNTSANASTLTINNTDNFIFAGRLGVTQLSTAARNFSVVKNGGGTQTFSGVRSYTGHTTVSAGTLSLATVNAFDELSTVTIAESAFLQLDYAGTDTVDKLFVGATQLAPGEYGNIDSVFPIKPLAQITGNGTLNVTTGPVAGGFSSWITGTFAGGATVPGGQQGPNQDFDNDGISNLVEYAVAGEDPTVPNATVGTFAANVLSFSKRLDATGLTYAIQESIDLGIADDWTEVTDTIPNPYVNNTTTISYTLTPGTPVKNFIRLQVLTN